MVTITGFKSADVRFPTSLDGTGSDAMNAAGDYSAAYCILETDGEYRGHGMNGGPPWQWPPEAKHYKKQTFTIGRGNDLVRAAIDHLAPSLLHKSLASLTENMGRTWRMLVSDSQLRWIGPEKGVIHLALGAVVNALWDLWARTEKKPVWRLVAEMTPEELVRCIDFRYIEDALTPAEAVGMLQEAEAGKQARMKVAEESRAVRAYTTSAGWIGYGDDKMRALLEEGVRQGWKYFKLKVGGGLEEDMRRLQIAREVIGYDRGNVLMVDANQVWSVPEAIEYMKALARFKPWFIEEPTSPDDILGHAAIRAALAPLDIGVATGEMCQNRIVFKQLLQARAIDFCQVDACRLGGLNEVLAVLLLARRLGNGKVPVVPHSGGVGLPEYTQHVSLIDFVVVNGAAAVREDGTGLLEYVEHLHEHFVHPARVREGGWWVAPEEAGYSVEMKEASMAEYAFPGEEGGFWRSEAGRRIVEGERR